ncbi:hypothetical protein [uncultured Campylobacter sp.]|uniref:hypothetical protein n=1 Tax=uncultured Campylobacter sp. TaxID=218934 RepID=UPI00260BFDEA|nr:hypothetical protein [uncultured Campylobacter sp.]
MRANLDATILKFHTEPREILKFHAMSIGCYADLARYVSVNPRNANSAQKHGSHNQAALKILTATSKIPLAASLRWPS